MKRTVLTRLPRVIGRPQFILKTIEYEFPDELWRIIKEYAGIYDIKINWDYGLDRYISCMNNVLNMRWTNIHRGSAEHSINVMKKGFWNKCNKNPQKKKLYLENVSKEFVNKPKVYKTAPPKDLKVGDEVLIFTQAPYYERRRLGVVTKLLKTGFHARHYQYKRIKDAFEGWNRDKIIWLKNKPLDKEVFTLKHPNSYDYKTSIFRDSILEMDERGGSNMTGVEN